MHQQQRGLCVVAHHRHDRCPAVVDVQPHRYRGVHPVLVLRARVGPDQRHGGAVLVEEGLVVHHPFPRGRTDLGLVRLERHERRLHQRHHLLGGSGEQPAHLRVHRVGAVHDLHQVVDAGHGGPAMLIGQHEQCPLGVDQPLGLLDEQPLSRQQRRHRRPPILTGDLGVSSHGQTLQRVQCLPHVDVAGGSGMDQVVHSGRWHRHQLLVHRDGVLR